MNSTGKKKKALLNPVHECNRQDTSGLWYAVSHATSYHLFDTLLDTFFMLDTLIYSFLFNPIEYHLTTVHTEEQINLLSSTVIHLLCSYNKLL